MSGFLVTIRYREPTYELQTGVTRTPYKWTYRIEAITAALAKEIAIGQFHAVAALSSVGWVREVVSVDAVLRPPDPQRLWGGEP